MEKPVDWEGEGNKIVRNFEFENFNQALEFVNKVGQIAENVNHHPDIFLHDYKQVKITLSTHETGGVSEKDFGLAKAINDI